MFGLLEDSDIGKTLGEIEEGETLYLTEEMKEKDLLLYLGLTGDSNPLFIQKDYARQTEYKKPLVPSIMLMGIITSAISKHLPGPGSHVTNFSANFIRPVVHGETLTFKFEVIKVDQMKDVITLDVEAMNRTDERALDAVVMVAPPKEKEGEQNE